MALDLSGPKNPPPAKRSAQSAQAANKAAAAKISAREEGVNGLFQIGSAVCLMVGQPADAGTLANYGPNVSHEVAELAEGNESIARVIDYITAVGPYAGLLATVLPMALQLLANHGKVAPEALAQFGVVHPDAIAAEYRTKALRAQMEAVQAQADAEREMQRMQQEALASVNGGREMAQAE